MRSPYITLSVLFIVSVLVIMGIYLYAFDYQSNSSVFKKKGGSGSSSNSSSDNIINFRKSEQGLEARITCKMPDKTSDPLPLSIHIKNTNTDKVSFLGEKWSICLELLSETPPRIFELNPLFASQGSEFPSSIPARSLKLPAPEIRFYCNIFSVISSLDPGTYKFRLKLGLQIANSPEAHLTSNILEFFVPERRY